MSVYLVLVPVAVMVSSFLFIDARDRWLKGLGFVLLFGGFAAVMACVTVVAQDADHRAELCASRRGTMVAGNCWIDGEKQ